MDATLADLKASNSLSISETARKYGVGRSALSRRLNLKATSTAQYRDSTRLLNNTQERELLRYSRRLCERCLPPTPRIVANVAQELCGKTPSKNWATRFVARHKDQLDARYLNTLDLARHKTDSRVSYEYYFDILSPRIKKYDVLPENIYNMDEKGFLIGRLHKTQRVFTKDLYKQGKLVGPGQDGSREWITVVTIICADGTSLSPTLIYKAVSGNLEIVWIAAQCTHTYRRKAGSPVHNAKTTQRAKPFSNVIFLKSTDSSFSPTGTTVDIGRKSSCRAGLRMVNDNFGRSSRMNEEGRDK
jgi:hypothetical protein